MAQKSQLQPIDERPWMVSIQALFYLGLFAALMFYPGTSLLERLHWLDSGICAQLPGHSFYPGGQPLPLCARNTGIYLGFIVTLLMLYATGHGRAQRLPRWPIIVVLLVGALALVVDGFNSLFLDLGLRHLYQPHNLLRLATGLATGLALAALSLPALNYLFWREDNRQRSVPSWTTLILLIPGLVFSFFAVVSQSGLILYPVALLSTAGIVTLVSSVNLLLIVTIGKRDQTFTRYRELLPFFSLALLLALGEMLLLAQLKFSLLSMFGM